LKSNQADIFFLILRSGHLAASRRMRWHRGLMVETAPRLLIMRRDLPTAST
jgi:hypothetical protein